MMTLNAAELVNLDDKVPKFQMSATDTGDRLAMIERLMSPEYESLYVNLWPYVDQSSLSIPATFSIERGYNLFRSLGLRHLTVVDKFNHVVGVISRKDLLEGHVDSRIQKTKTSATAIKNKGKVNDEILERSRSNSLIPTPNNPFASPGASTSGPVLGGHSFASPVFSQANPVAGLQSPNTAFDLSEP